MKTIVHRIFLTALLFSGPITFSTNSEARHHWYFNTFYQGTSGPCSTTTGKIITTVLILCAAFAWHYYKHNYLPQPVPPVLQEAPADEQENENILDELTENRAPIFNACFNDEKKRYSYSELALETINESGLSIEQALLGQELLKKPTLLVCVHGTWSNTAEFGHVDASQPLACAIKQFARHLVQYTQAPVHLISFNWSGTLCEQARQEAGKVLAETIIKQKFDYNSIWTVAYSHGCNVVNHMAHILKHTYKKPIPIKGVHIASPITPEESLLVKNIDHVYHFYSLADITQLCGSIEAKSIAESLLDLFENTRIYNEENVTNIRIQQNGFDLGHLQIKLPVLLQLPYLLFTIDSWYAMYRLVDVNVDHNFDKCVACVRDMSKMHEGNYNALELKRAHDRHIQQKNLFFIRYAKNIEDRHIKAEYVS